MNLKNKKIHALRFCFLSVFLAASVFGCGFGKYGKADMTYQEIKAPSGLKNKSKANVIKTLGVPDSSVTGGGIEYWRYVNKSGFFVCVYGVTQEKDLVLELKGDKVTSSYLVDKGSSTGILAFQGAVAN